MQGSDVQVHEVLTSFARECRAPTEEDLADWQIRYPRYAHALAKAARKRMADAPLEAFYASGEVEVVLEAQMRELYPDGMPRPLDEMLEHAGVDLREVADDLCVGEDLLTKLARGDLMHPIGSHVLEAFAKAFQISPRDVSHAVTASIVAQWTTQESLRDGSDFAAVTWADAVGACWLTENHKGQITE